MAGTAGKKAGAISIHPDDMEDPIPSVPVDPDLANPYDLLIPRRSDRTDQFDRITLEVPPFIMPAIESILHSGNWPWRDPKSFARSAVYLLIRKAQASSPPEMGFLGALDASLQQMRVVEYSQQFDDFFQQLNEQVTWFVDRGEFAQLKIHLERIETPFAEMQEKGWDGYWRKRWMETFYQRYGAWL